MATLTAMKRERRKLERQAKRIENRLYVLGLRIWDAEVKAVKPSQMCRLRWQVGYECALKQGHEGCCQGNAPSMYA